MWSSQLLRYGLLLVLVGASGFVVERTIELRAQNKDLAESVLEFAEPSVYDPSDTQILDPAHFELLYATSSESKANPPVLAVLLNGDSTWHDHLRPWVQAMRGEQAIELRIIVMKAENAKLIEEFVRSEDLTLVRIVTPRNVTQFIAESAVEYLPMIVAVNPKMSVQAVSIGVATGAVPGMILRSAASNRGVRPPLIELFPGGTKLRPAPADSAPGEFQ